MLWRKKKPMWFGLAAGRGTNMIWKQLSNLPFCIYGAGIVAMSAYTAIKALYDERPLFFLISDSEDLAAGDGEKIGFNLKKTNGVPVKNLSEWKRELNEAKLREREQQYRRKGNFESNITIPELYLVAVPEIHHASIVKSLRELQIKEENIILFTNRRENDLMEAYYSNVEGYRTIKRILPSEKTQRQTKENANFLDTENIAMGKKPGDCRNRDSGLHKEDGRSEKPEKSAEAFLAENFRVYQAKSHMDKPLSRHNILSGMPSYIFPIQVGSALTERIICDLQDNADDTISEKNRNYCELTATYYAWKHGNAPYKGICHYRRIFDISDEQMQELLKAADKWDVILPYPSVHYPDISVQHTRYIREDDWNAMLQALGELEPEYLEAYEKSVLTGEKFFNNFNMLIAKAAVFDDYCSFLFRILERTEELTTPKGWEREDRFAGYLGENLTTLYFLKNRDRCKTLYAGKIWMT